MAQSLTAPIRPRRAMASLPTTTTAAVVVAGTGLVSGVLGITSRRIDGVPLNAAELVPLLVLPVLFLLFWLGSGRLIDGGVQMMGRPSRRRPILAGLALAFPILLIATLLTVIQAVLFRAGAGDPMLIGVGLLNLVVFAWFIAIWIVAITTVSDIPASSALALALLPLAVLALLVMLYIVLFSGLHAAGVV